MGYNRPLRIVAATIRTIAEMITDAIGAAVAASFFIYFLGLPHEIMVMGIALPTFTLVVATSLTLSMVIIWAGGCISLLISDAFQGLMSCPIFVVISWLYFPPLWLARYDWSCDD